MMLLLLFESEVKRGEFKHVWLACFMFAVVVVVGDRCCCITTKGVAAWRSLVAPRAPELGTRTKTRTPTFRAELRTT